MTASEAEWEEQRKRVKQGKKNKTRRDKGELGCRVRDLARIDDRHLSLG